MGAGARRCLRWVGTWVGVERLKDGERRGQGKGVSVWILGNKERTYRRREESSVKSAQWTADSEDWRDPK